MPTERSALGFATATAEDVVLFPERGSAVGDDAFAEPPAITASGVAPAGTSSDTFSVVVPLAAIGPATVHDNGPAGSGPVQPAGNAAIDTPVGGVYKTAIGPAAFEGPTFWIEIVAVPVAPGTIVGVDTDVTRSAEPAATATLNEDALLPSSGSETADTSAYEPPVRYVFGAAPEGTASGIAIANGTPICTTVVIVQVNGPAGNVPVQPAGNEVMLTPTGGVKPSVIGPG
jgi:hypothetical protein